MLVSAVDVIFADIAQPDQARIVIHNAQSFLKDGGHVLISIKASCIDSTVAPETIFAAEVETLKQSQFKPIEQVTLEPYERDHAMVSGELSSHLEFRHGIPTTAHSRLPTTQKETELIFSPCVFYFVCTLSPGKISL